MTVDAWMADWGLVGLALFACLAATLVPVSSELAVLTALSAGLDRWSVLLAASLGNAAGAFLDYSLGRLLADRVHARLSRSAGGRRALAWAARWGPWCLLLSWLPIVGDPLCVVAGAFRFPRSAFWLLGVGTRVLRYVVVIALWHGESAG